MEFAKSCYYAFFMAIYDALNVLSFYRDEEESLAWRAMAVLTALQGVFLAALRHWYDVVSPTKAQVITRNEALGLFLVLVAFNYLVILRDVRWKTHLRGHPELRGRNTKLLARSTVVAVFFFCVFTFLHMSQVV